MSEQLIIRLCFIFIAHLKDAPQVRIQSTHEPFMSVESCKQWCEQHCFSYVIKDWKTKEVIFRSDD